jgi:hypothetical protein
VGEKVQSAAGVKVRLLHWDTFAEARPYYEAALAGVVQTGEAYYADEAELMLRLRLC